MAVLKNGQDWVVAFPPDPDIINFLSDNGVAIMGEPKSELSRTVYGVLRAMAPLALLAAMTEAYFHVDERDSSKWNKEDDVTDLYSGDIPKDRLPAVSVRMLGACTL